MITLSSASEPARIVQAIRAGGDGLGAQGRIPGPPAVCHPRRHPGGDLAASRARQGIVVRLLLREWDRRRESERLLAGAHTT